MVWQNANHHVWRMPTAPTGVCCLAISCNTTFPICQASPPRLLIAPTATKSQAFGLPGTIPAHLRSLGVKANGLSQLIPVEPHLHDSPGCLSFVLAKLQMHLHGVIPRGLMFPGPFSSRQPWQSSHGYPSLSVLGFGDEGDPLILLAWC